MRRVEGQVHAGERHPEARRASQTVGGPAARAGARRGAARSAASATLRKAVPPEPSVVEEGLGQRAPELHGGHGEEDEDGSGHGAAP